MKPTTKRVAMRVPVSVRVGRKRWTFRMPPVYIDVLPTTGGVQVATREGRAFRVALRAAKVLLIPLAALARLCRADVELTVGPETTP